MLEAIESGRVRSMLNKTMPAAPLHQPGALLLGDAFNMRHPLTGTHPSEFLTLCVTLLGDLSDACQTPNVDRIRLREVFSLLLRGCVTAGGGMTVALSDTKLLYDMLRPLMSFHNPATTARATSRFYTERKPMSATINTLANARSCLWPRERLDPSSSILASREMLSA